LTILFFYTTAKMVHPELYCLEKTPKDISAPLPICSYSGIKKVI
jgi:hypothetical protein